MTALNIAQVKQDFGSGTLICRATIGKVIAMAAAKVEFTEAQISAAGRALADISAEACSVDNGDNWEVCGHEFIEMARAVLNAAKDAA